MAAAPETEDGMRALGIRMACVVARCAKGQDTCQMSKDLPSGTGCRRGGVGGNLLQIFVCVYLPRLKNILWHGVYARSWGGALLHEKSVRQSSVSAQSIRGVLPGASVTLLSWKVLSGVRQLSMYWERCSLSPLRYPALRHVFVVRCHALRTPVEPPPLVVGLRAVRPGVDRLDPAVQDLCKAVGFHDPGGGGASLRPFRPTRHDPLSVSMVARVPNLPTAFPGASIVFPWAACVKTIDAMMHHEESSGHVTGRWPRNCGSLISCQPACHMASECLLPSLIRLRLLDFGRRHRQTVLPHDLVWAGSL